MKNFIHQIDQTFYWWGTASKKWGKWILIIIVLMLGLLWSHLPDIRLDTSLENFIDQNDPTRVAYDHFKAQFGREDLVLVAMAFQKSITLDDLATIRSFHHALETTIPFTEDVLSIVNARVVRGADDTLLVEDLSKTWPKQHSDIPSFMNRITRHPLYRNQLISEDGKLVVFLITLSSFSAEEDLADISLGFDEGDEGYSVPMTLSDKDQRQAIHAIQDLLEKTETHDLKIYLTGSPPMVTTVSDFMMADMPKVTGMAFLLIMGVLFLVFKRLSGVFLPLFIVALSILSTIATMAWVGVAFKVPTQILPSFLLAIGIADSIHIISMFFQYYKKSGDRSSAVAEALRHSGLAVLLTSITTAAGMLSFSLSDLIPISELGIFACIGVLFALFFSVVLLPILLHFLPIKQPSLTQESWVKHAINQGLQKLAHSAQHYPKIIIGIAGLIGCWAILGMMQLHFAHDPLSWLPKDSHLSESTRVVDQTLNGSISAEIILKTPHSNGFLDPENMTLLSTLKTETKDLKDPNVDIGKVTSIEDLMREINQALHNNNPIYYQIPESKSLIAQELLLFENSGSDDLNALIDNQYQTARMTLRVPWVDAVVLGDFVDRLSGQVEQTVDDKVTFSMTGLIPVLVKTLRITMTSLTQSYLIAGLVITLLMVLLLGRLGLGLLSMIPNMFPILCCLGFMGWFGFPLDMVTILIGSIALGLVVDDTVHFLHNFRRYHSQSGQTSWAINESLRTVGVAIFVTTLALCAGFSVFMTSSFTNIFNFGLLLSLTMLMAILSDLLVLPAILVIISRLKKEPGHA